MVLCYYKINEINMMAGLRTGANDHCIFLHYQQGFNVVVSNLKGQVKFKRGIGYLGQEKREQKHRSRNKQECLKTIAVIFIGM